MAVREVLTPAEVAELFRVNTETVTKWGNDGKLDYCHTPGGSRRYYKDEVLLKLREGI